MDYKRYEWAMFNQLYYDFRPPKFIVVPDFREVIGTISGIKRQIDVAIFRANDSVRPYIMVECKRFKRKLDIKTVESFIAMTQDIKPKHAILATPHGFTKGAERRAKGEGIVLVTLSIPEVIRLNHRDLIRQIFPWDETFHPQMGDAFFQFTTSNKIHHWLESLEGLMFEEWERQIYLYFSEDDIKCLKLLREISLTHYDDGWRFNAIRLLKEFNDFDDELRETLNFIEKDPECLDLINDNNY